VSGRLYNSLVSWPGEIWRKQTTGREGVVHVAACTLLYVNHGCRPDDPKTFEDLKGEVANFVDRWWPAGETEKDGENNAEKNTDKNSDDLTLALY